ncbi:transposase family protein [Streptomyces canus]|uniref:transposase family protein n=1 Tax=Streptomyces canus TaxID=58343 RepID=UPI003AF24669
MAKPRSRVRPGRTAEIQIIRPRSSVRARTCRRAGSCRPAPCSVDSLVCDETDDVDVQVVTALRRVDTVTRGRSVGEVCPGCGPVSNRVHGSCQRRLQDLPFGGQRVGILLRHLRRAVLAANLCAATPSQIAHAPDSEAAVLRPSSHIRQR